MRIRFAAVLATAALLTAVGCNDNPVAVEEDHDDTLTAEFTLSANHVHTLSEIEFKVRILDHHGSPVTDLESVTVDRLLEGGDAWRSTDLERHGDEWHGTYTFTTSGAYAMRVSVLHHGAAEAEVVHTMAEHLSVGRAHVEVGSYRVEFESFPGHLHEGQDATMRFWVMEAERNADGVRPPVTGLRAHIECREASGMMEEHMPTESAPGVYETMHTFAEAGEFVASMHLDAGRAEFTTHVAHAH